MIAGTGPLKQYLKVPRRAFCWRAKDSISDSTSTPICPIWLRSGDLFVHCSIADIESVSVIEGDGVRIGAGDRRVRTSRRPASSR